ncbi:MAG: hypothetical protein M1827_005579 [Pycnora praestabilis]|nr:MAG: hypothetical protein M1827_005579 [Pycnora praestabilis]
MTTVLPASPRDYSAYCYSASPTFNTWVKLTAANVHALQIKSGFEGQNIYFHTNHPIRYVRLVGVLVAVEEYPQRWILTLDDSSGATIDVVCGKPQNPNANANTKPDPTVIGDLNSKEKELVQAQCTQGISHIGCTVLDFKDIDIGSVVKVKGSIGTYWGARQVMLERISIIHTTNEESAAWAELSSFRATVLSKPWYLPPEAERNLLEEANGVKRREEERRRRKRERKSRQEENEKSRTHKARKETKRKKEGNRRLKEDVGNHEKRPLRVQEGHRQRNDRDDGDRHRENRDAPPVKLRSTTHGAKGH